VSRVGGAVWREAECVSLMTRVYIAEDGSWSPPLQMHTFSGTKY
jgi:hypothetical protein